ncbi:DNA recombination protein RmuC [Catalinimonas alkaloidigena]|uniref:DNA recombination protein RmuC n=1 Tax=Catalinimonas alkaloidigena TaxID=1075417 RepID=UPI002406CD5C|nr:DNA recombination protein RmuC [Catalinimonas alkaloidigena]MDF9794843.1 DNA recombination protein RmuC [Catalinimonas alkaloidigena]
MGDSFFILNETDDIDMIVESLLLLAAVILGAMGGWFAARFRYQRPFTNPQEIERKYISKELYSDAKRELYDSQQQVLRLTKTLAAKEQQNQSLHEQLLNQKSDIQDLQQQFRHEFKSLANELLEEKSQKFTALNEEKLSYILNPLKEKITDFRSKMEQTYHEEIRERASLRKEIEQLMHLNQQISEDAIRLTKALKGDSKVQGDWGEMQLELILEKAGLEKNIHYSSQSSFNDQTEERTQRPDYIINLPESKHLILDAKVSLTAYENYYNTEDQGERNHYLKEHLDSIYRHMKGLSEKNYQQLYQINQPDYVIMFVPLEPALTAALREDAKVFEKCLDKNIVLVSTSTLLATLRTISYIWKQENQKKNVVEIAVESGKLYDKFVGFVDDLGKIENSLQSAQGHYQQAVNKLCYGKGNLVRRVEKLKELGANASKSIPDTFLDKSIEVRKM